MDHCEPSQRSASGKPTPVHALVEVHDTPASWVDWAPAGVAVCSTDQLAPFQRTAIIPPTARHPVADAQETPVSSPLEAGRRWRDQRLPSHRSTKFPPTAVHALGVV